MCTHSIFSQRVPSRSLSRSLQRSKERSNERHNSLPKRDPSVLYSLSLRLTRFRPTGVSRTRPLLLLLGGTAASCLPINCRQFSLSPSFFFSLSLSLSHHFTIIFSKKPSHLGAWWWKNTSQEFKKKRRKERGRRLREKERKNRSLVLEKKRIAVDSRARFFASGSPDFFSADGADSAKRQRRQKVVSLTNRSTHSKYISKSISKSTMQPIVLL